MSTRAFNLSGYRADEPYRGPARFLVGFTHFGDATGPARFKLVAQIPDRGDKLDDPSTVWPSTRRTVTLGTLSITKAVADSAAQERQLLFTPTALTAGIEAADPTISRPAAKPMGCLSAAARNKSRSPKAESHEAEARSNNERGHNAGAEANAPCPGRDLHMYRALLHVQRGFHHRL